MDGPRVRCPCLGAFQLDTRTVFKVELSAIGKLKLGRFSVLESELGAVLKVDLLARPVDQHTAFRLVTFRIQTLAALAVKLVAVFGSKTAIRFQRVFKFKKTTVFLDKIVTVFKKRSGHTSTLDLTHDAGLKCGSVVAAPRLCARTSTIFQPRGEVSAHAGEAVVLRFDLAVVRAGE